MALWRRWFTAAGLADVALDDLPGVEYDIDQFHITAAIEGHGIALASPDVFSLELQRGRQIRPFAQAISNDTAYWLVYPTAHRQAPKIVAFRAWLLAEARAQRQVDKPPRPRRTR